MMQKSPDRRDFSHICNMLSEVRLYAAAEIAPFVHLQKLHKQLLCFSFFNLFLVGTTGLVLRIVPLLQGFPLSYHNMLHGHSHFAFGGWVFPILIWMIMQFFPQLPERIAYHHWRNIMVMSLVAAYGMLLSFPFEGYAGISISFSTLSLAAGIYLAVVIWKITKADREKIGIRFLRAGLFYMTLSALGPLALGPIMALHKTNTPIYQDAIYFYLHFQYNGWFLFALLAVGYVLLERYHHSRHGKKVFRLFHWSCIPVYFLSILWHQPSAIFYIIGGAATLLQLAGVYFLLADLKKLKLGNPFAQWLFMIAIMAFVLKSVLQIFSAFPIIADFAFQHHDLIIAYLHLVLLGIVSLFAFASIIYTYGSQLPQVLKTGVILFLFGFTGVETLLVLHGFDVVKLFYQEQLIGFTLLLPISVLIILRPLVKIVMKDEVWSLPVGRFPIPGLGFFSKIVSRRRQGEMI